MDAPRALPRLGLLRELTDRHVLQQLVGGDPLTRAEIAARTGISKPTISEAVRRLAAAGLLVESGQQVGKRGPSGLYFRIRAEAAAALAVSVGPDGVRALRYDLTGTTTAEVQRPLEVPTDAGRVGPVLVEAVRAALPAEVHTVRSVTLSVAGPVDQDSGRLVALPDSPFLLGELRAVELLADLLPVRARVDNDVNWAALAEHHEGGAQDLSEFFYAYLGPGIGGASVSRGAVRHGSSGLAGELAHVRTAGPGGRSLRLVECLAAEGLLLPGSPAVDVPRVAALLAGRTPGDRRVRDRLVRAVAGALASVAALLDPRAVVLAGPWGTAADFAERVGTELAELAPVPTPVRAAALGVEASLAGARIMAVQALHDELLG